MILTVQYDCLNIDWNYVSEILMKAEMAHFKGELHKKSFENSQAAIYDVAVLPKYQG